MDIESLVELFDAELVEVDPVVKFKKPEHAKLFKKILAERDGRIGPENVFKNEKEVGNVCENCMNTCWTEVFPEGTKTKYRHCTECQIRLGEIEL